jgi:Rrf2 family protein
MVKPNRPIGSERAMKLLSDAAEYALRAVVWLARNDQGPRTTRQIAAGTKATPGYLARVLQMLGSAGMVKGKRGVAGGFVLARDPRDLTVLEIIDAVDPLERIGACPLDLTEHSEGLCALHARIDLAIAQLRDAFGRMTIAQILSEPPGRAPLCEPTISAIGD